MTGTFRPPSVCDKGSRLSAKAATAWPWGSVRPSVYLKVKPKGRARHPLWLLNARVPGSSGGGSSPQSFASLCSYCMPTAVAPADVTVPDGPGGPATQVLTPHRSRACARVCYRWWGRLPGSWVSRERKLRDRDLEGWQRTRCPQGRPVLVL